MFLDKNREVSHFEWEQFPDYVPGKLIRLRDGHAHLSVDDGQRSLGLLPILRTLVRFPSDIKTGEASHHLYFVEETHDHHFNMLPCPPRDCAKFLFVLESNIIIEIYTNSLRLREKLYPRIGEE